MGVGVGSITGPGSGISAGGFTGGGIDFEGAALELEGAVDGVECGVEGPVDSGGCGIESDGERRLRLLREGAGGERKQEGATQGREVTPRQTKSRLTWGTPSAAIAVRFHAGAPFVRKLQPKRGARRRRTETRFFSPM